PRVGSACRGQLGLAHPMIATTSGKLLPQTSAEGTTSRKLRRSWRDDAAGADPRLGEGERQAAGTPVYRQPAARAGRKVHQAVQVEAGQQRVGRVEGRAGQDVRRAGDTVGDPRRERAPEGTPAEA